MQSSMILDVSRLALGPAKTERLASDCRIQKLPNSCPQIAQPTVYRAKPSTGQIGDHLNGATLLRRDLRRRNFFCPFIFCDG